MSPTLTTFLFEVANFLVLVSALGWFFFRPVRNALAQRRNEWQRQTDEAAQGLADARRIQSEVEQQRAALTREADAMRAQAQVDAHRETEQILQQAHELARKRQKAEAERLIDAERAQTGRMAQAVAQSTGVLAARLLALIEGPDLEDALFSAACRELKRHAPQQASSIVVESSQELDPRKRETLAEILGQSHGRLEFRVNPKLLGGLRVATDAGLVDVSVAGLANGIEKLLNSELERIAAGSSHA